jgi:hypothetical protein
MPSIPRTQFLSAHFPLVSTSVSHLLHLSPQLPSSFDPPPNNRDETFEPSTSFPPSRQPCHLSHDSSIRIYVPYPGMRGLLDEQKLESLALKSELLRRDQYNDTAVLEHLQRLNHQTSSAVVCFAPSISVLSGLSGIFRCLTTLNNI